MFYIYKTESEKFRTVNEYCKVKPWLKQFTIYGRI